MNWDQIKTNWNIYKTQIQERWNMLTNDDVNATEGNREELARRIQLRYGITQDEVERQLTDFMGKVGPTSPGHATAPPPSTRTQTRNKPMNTRTDEDEDADEDRKVG